jgi:hypothetical protein
VTVLAVLEGDAELERCKPTPPGSVLAGRALRLRRRPLSAQLHLSPPHSRPPLRFGDSSTAAVSVAGPCSPACLCNCLPACLPACLPGL